MHRHGARALTAFATVIAALAVTAPSPGASAAANCHGFANMPRPVDLHSTLPRLYAWGEFQCDAPASLAVQVCAIRFTPTPVILDDKSVWCMHRIVKVTPGRWKTVRTPMHACTPGKGYASYIRIIGQPWDRGAWTLCRSL
jgi:hypothetical protein